jgi:hypothetical protein
VIWLDFTAGQQDLTPSFFQKKDTFSIICRQKMKLGCGFSTKLPLG